MVLPAVHGLTPVQRINEAIQTLHEALEEVRLADDHGKAAYLIYLAYNDLAPLVPAPLRGVG